MLRPLPTCATPMKGDVVKVVRLTQWSSWDACFIGGINTELNCKKMIWEGETNYHGSWAHVLLHTCISCVGNCSHHGSLVANRKGKVGVVGSSGGVVFNVDWGLHCASAQRVRCIPICILKNNMIYFPPMWQGVNENTHHYVTSDFVQKQCGFVVTK